MANTALDLFRLNGRHAVIAGGAGLLGPTFAEALLEADGIVTILDRNQNELEKVKHGLSRFGERCNALPCDVTIATSVEAAVEHSEKLAPIRSLLILRPMPLSRPKTPIPDSQLIQPIFGVKHWK
jgi:NAD(P)-dependent dehydrogenase (short-subunit alcohol dehydrogenase family)